MDKETSEIAKLTERIEKDPKSKLFVPLAEEYKKAGDMEMAIHVLTEGLKNNPGYVTAKSFLGRLLFEQGDLAGAKKEFEEVVKAIPDNLLAQRKLGDIFALQENASSARKHYQLVLSLNPNDEEVTSLVSDLEAGRSVKERLSKPTTTSVPEQVQKEHPGKAAAKPGARNDSVAGASAVPVQNIVPLKGVQEEPEEVLLVEPLAQEAPAAAGIELASSIEFLDQASSQNEPAEAGQAEGVAEPSAPYQVSLEPGIPEEPGDIEMETLPGSGVAEQVPLDQEARSDDDFSTNTLAELYIQQGFYEKAIDIYERMVADNPGNQALEEKLAHVRAMAGQAPAEEMIPDTGDSVPPPEPMAWGTEPETPAEFGGPQPGEYELPEPTVDLSEGMPSEFVPPGGGDFPQALSPEAGFEPAEHQSTVSDAQQPAGIPVQDMSASVPPERQATISRLESWLKNIMREKQK